jgi:hypothetical protein
MIYSDAESQSDPLAPLVAAISDQLLEKALTRLRSEWAAQAAETKPQRVLLSLAEAGRRYGVGRILLRRLIASGKLDAVTRRCRGGRIGQFLHVADCERVLAGRKA